jgi:hypothetical protein
MSAEVVTVTLITRRSLVQSSPRHYNKALVRTYFRARALALSGGLKTALGYLSDARLTACRHSSRSISAPNARAASACMPGITC